MLRETGMAEVNGALIYYEVSGEGEPLVLVPAGIADGRMWDGQVEDFAHRYRVVRYDMRGFGKTGPVEGPYSHHEDLRGLLDSLEIGRTHLGGCSMGGGAVLDFALRYPERVGARSPGGVSRWRVRGGLRAPRAMGRAGRRRRGGRPRAGLRARGPDLGRRSQEASRRRRRLRSGSGARDEPHRPANEASGLGEELPPDPPAVDRLAEIVAPALILVGDSDQPRTLAAANLLAKKLPNARKAVMTGTARLSNMERPEEFNQILLDYLEDVR